MKAKLNVCQTLMTMVGGRKRKFIAKEVDGQEGKRVIYDFTVKEWEEIKGRLDEKGRPYFIPAEEVGVLDKVVKSEVPKLQRRQYHF
jgi:hypothetical protein